VSRYNCDREKLLCPARENLQADNKRLRTALIAAKAEIEWWANEHSCCDGHQFETVELIDAALAEPKA
jgi:hypothetical protein